MTLSEFIKNPVGKGDASVNIRLITEALNAKYMTWITRERNNIEVKVYTGKDFYLVKLITPTETDRGNTTDVVFKFTDTKKEHAKDRSVEKYDIQLFSNSHSFVYTYAYVYNKNKLVIQELKGKLPSRCFTDSPKVRNRNELILFDKYIYFAAKFLLSNDQLSKDMLGLKSRKIANKQAFIAKVRSFKQIEEEYNKAEQIRRANKKRRQLEEKELSRLQSTKPSKDIRIIGKQSGTMLKNKNNMQKKSGTGSNNIRMVSKKKKR